MVDTGNNNDDDDDDGYNKTRVYSYGAVILIKSLQSLHECTSFTR